ncbi:hypothetical protein G9A89_020424 [Geosiphon pyriformis]|nr:hypothetical protein G9A89_020424 [Geosiphon pyriformis]
MPLGFQSPPPQPDFGTISSWKQTQNNSNPETINWQNLSSVILLQQQQQQQQQPNLDPMAYAPIAKLEKFMGKEDNAQVWLNNVEKAITTNK